jgi:peptide/nickel transport system permease protein
MTRRQVDVIIARLAQLLLLVVGVVGVAAPLLTTAPHVTLADDLAPPRHGLPLGAGELGVDVVAALVWGARGAVAVGSSVAVAATLVAVMVALLLSRAGPRTRRILSRGIDAWLAFPSLLLAAALQALMPPSLLSIIAVLIVTSWAGPSRVLLAMADVAWKSPHVEAARALGASRLRLALVHVAPQLGPIVAVSGTQTFGAAIVAEASLSFLGLGPPPLQAPFFVSWGTMLDDGAALFFAAPHLWWPPALAIFVVAAASQLATRGR